jgi:putative phosphoesterase
VRVGLISDTHGLLRPEALAALRGAGHIIHAGDIGAASVLEALAAIAPLTAIRGNNDTGPWAQGVPETAEIRLGGKRIFVIHDLAGLRGAHRHDVVVSGHSHQLKEFVKDGTLYVNPGSAGPRRFALPVSVGYLDIGPAGVAATLVTLDVAKR